MNGICVGRDFLNFFYPGWMWIVIIQRIESANRAVALAEEHDAAGRHFGGAAAVKFGLVNCGLREMHHSGSNERFANAPIKVSLPLAHRSEG